ncbi:MAG: hypothetical protein H7338_13520 [Candidatus Sericytochromatia bacterium]|nr:hypothetical protein [Candidatus Sericytochromatia bacterium]
MTTRRQGFKAPLLLMTGLLLGCLPACGAASAVSAPIPRAAETLPVSPWQSAAVPKRIIQTKVGLPQQAGVTPAARTGIKPVVRPTPVPTAAVVYLQAPDFRLKDQNDKLLAYSFPKGKPSVLAFGDQKGSDQLDGWIKPLYARFTDQVDIDGVAELSAVPGFARGMVRGIMGSLVPKPIMLDWDASVSKAYGYKGGQAAILVINASGGIVWRGTGAVTQTGLDEVARLIGQLLQAA